MAADDAHRYVHSSFARMMTWARLTFVEELLGAARVVLPVVVAGAAGVRRHAQYGSLADL